MEDYYFANNRLQQDSTTFNTLLPKQIESLIKGYGNLSKVNAFD
jgi:hypothetical protein